MATRKKSMLRTWAEREAERIESVNAAKTFRQPSAPIRRSTATGQDWATGITQDVLGARKEAIRINEEALRSATILPYAPPTSQAQPLPAGPTPAPMAPAGIAPAPAPAFTQKPINDTSYEDQGFSRRDNARNNFLADTTNKGVQVVNPVSGTNAIGDKIYAWGTQAKGAPAPAAPSVASNDGRIHWENLGSHYQKPGIQPAQTAQPTAVAATEPAMSPDIMADMDSLAGPSEGTSIGPASTPPVVQQEPKAQATPGSNEVIDAIANGSKGSNQRKQSVADFVLKRKLPSELPGSRQWSRGNNPNAIKPASLPPQYRNDIRPDGGVNAIYRPPLPGAKYDFDRLNTQA